MSTAIPAQLQLRPLRAKPGLEQAASPLSDWLPFVFLALHIPMALLLSRSTQVSTLHGVLTAAVGVWLAVRSGKHPERVAYAAAYVVGAEVLWRMTRSDVYWEFGKYAISGIFLIHLMLNRPRKLPSAPLLYLGLLMPSTFITLMSVGDYLELHKALSFYLSGPLALTVAWCFFSQLKLSTKQLQHMFFALLCPTLGVATVALSGTLTVSRLAFTSESNIATSGGFGPNQVSGALGLGAVCALIWLVTSKHGWIKKFLIFSLLAVLASQAALTFSRGGLYNAAGSSIVALCFFLKDRQSRGRMIMAIGAIVLVGSFVILPNLDEFTGGALSARFKDVGVSKRDAIVRSDLNLWMENPVLGVGVGMAAVGRNMPHTEITRLLAEHGLFGLTALGVLLISSVQAVIRARGNKGKAVASSMVAFTLLFTLDKAMRLAAPSFTFGLAFAMLIPDEDPRRRKRRRSRSITGRRNLMNLRRRLPGRTSHRRGDESFNEQIESTVIACTWPPATHQSPTP